MPTARFFFDAGSGAVLWAGTEDREAWGYPVDLERLPISHDLRHGLSRLMARYDTSLNRDYPPDPGPWREAECQDFNEAVRQRSAAFARNSARRGRSTMSSSRSTKTRSSTAI